MRALYPDQGELKASVKNVMLDKQSPSLGHYEGPRPDRNGAARLAYRADLVKR